MIPETENPQEAKSVYPGKHAQADLGRYFTQRWFSRGTAHLEKCTFQFNNRKQMKAM